MNPRLATIALLGASCALAHPMDRYNVVWTSPSKDASGVMPIGNGDIAAGVYAVEGGDLYVLLAKNDAFDANGDILKTGRVRISLAPNPFVAGRPFRQTLDLATGSVLIEADGARLRLWADANRNVIHVQLDAPREVTVTARPDLWRRLDGTQDTRSERDGRPIWYHAVGDKSVYGRDLAYYGVEAMAEQMPDPYRWGTYGQLLEGPGLALADGALTGTAKSLDLRIHVHGQQTPDPETWLAALQRDAARPVDAAADWRRHGDWWREFWQRGWIIATDSTLPAEEREHLSGEHDNGVRGDADGAALVAQSYNVFRYLMACQSRGHMQTKFNGGLFTQQLRVGGENGRPGAVKLPDGTWLTHEDDRMWGRRFTYQNQRLLYWPLLASGDFDLMKPFLDYYWRLLPIRRAVTKAWFGHEGAYYRENIEPTGGEIDDAGRPDPPANKPPRTKPGERYEGWYHDYYFTSGLETLAMMLDYAAYTGDRAYRDQVAVPFAHDVLTFYDQHYPRDAAGRLRLEPAQVLETWWVAVNPAPDVAGLRFTLDTLLATGAGTAADQAGWRRFRGELPEVAQRTVDGKPAIAPAEKFDSQHNAENGELYAVFPFRLFGIAQGSADLVDWTMRHRTVKDAFGCGCWTQDQIHWACAGRAAEAAAGLVRRFRIASPMCRFPLYGREGPDSCPDFDHFGAGSVALQRMLVQEAGGKVFLLPAWPADWDADFRLHLAGEGVLSGQVKDGKLTTWDIQPATRRRDVVVGVPQVRAAGEVAIPANDHPLRIGADQDGGNRFGGAIGRVTMFRGKLTVDRIRQLAAGDRAQAVEGPDVVGCWLNPKAGDTVATKPEDYKGAVSFEAWIQPGENEAGRILDKLTPGVDDGMLFDTHPGLCLRLIAGGPAVSYPKVLRAGVWQHVAVVLALDGPRVYLDGVKR